MKHRPKKSANRSPKRSPHPNRAYRRNPPHQPDADYQYLIFNKPYDVLSQFTDRQSDRATLKQFIPVANVYPVGRLDRDSEGLLLLTNNGQLQHRLSNPKYGHPRTYWVQVERIPNDAAIAQLGQGVMIQGRPTRPAQVQRLDFEPDLPPRKSVPTCWLAMTLTEGRNRQVRRMTAAVGHPTLRLVRVAIGNLILNGLASGEWRPLTPQEQRTLLIENL